MVDQHVKQRFRSFHGGEPHFRAARVRCAVACRKYNSLPEDASAEQRAAAWQDIISSKGATPSPPVNIPVIGSEELSSNFSSLLATSPSSASTSPYSPSAAQVAGSRIYDASNSNLTPVLPTTTTTNGDHESHSSIRTPLSQEHSERVTPVESDAGLDSFDQPRLSRFDASKKPNGTPQAHANNYPGYGATPYVKSPIYIDYGTNVKIGGTTFVNRNCTILDTPVSEIRIGERCMFGPNVSLFGVSHPLDPVKRHSPTFPSSSVGADIVIGDDCWIGGNVTILAGVTIGDACVIGAGSIVTRSIPARSIAYGCPARVRRKLAASENTIGGNAAAAGLISIPVVPLAEEIQATESTALVFRSMTGKADTTTPLIAVRRTEILLAILVVLLATAVMMLGYMLLTDT